MARLTRDARLETREARTRLKQRHAPYWRSIHTGLSIGYRKGTRGATWIVRKLEGDDNYTFKSLGYADDSADANDIDILSYKQAHNKALEVSNTITVGGPYTVGQAAAAYLEWFKAHKKSHYQTDKTIRTHILPHFENRQANSLTTEEITRWHNRLARTERDDPEIVRKRKSTANRVLTVLKAVLNHAWRNNRVKDNSEWSRVRPFEAVEDSRKVFLQEDQCKRLINHAQGAIREYIQTLLYTGARPGKEVERFRVRDFDRESGTLRVTDGKTGGREIFLTDEGIKFFARLSAGREPDAFMITKDDGQPWGNNHYGRPLREAIARAKLPKGTTAYTLRHSYISFALKGGANIKVVADSCGTSVRMIEKHYAKFLGKDRRDMINAALPNFGLKKDSVRTLR